MTKNTATFRINETMALALMKYVSQMFMLFQRLHGRAAFEGTGPGLAIFRKIVEMHAGSIWAKGQEGEGATFFVSLPLNVPGN